jgi:hypothetical protein
VVRGLTTTSHTVDIRTSRGYVYRIYSIHTFLYNIFISNAIKCMTFTCMVFGMVHSSSTVVGLVHKHFRCWLSTFCYSVPISVHCMSESNMMPYVNNSFIHFLSAYCVSFLSKTYCLPPIITWVALGDVNLHFSLTMVRKPTQCCWINHMRRAIMSLMQSINTSHWWDDNDVTFC